MPELRWLNIMPPSWVQDWATGFRVGFCVHLTAFRVPQSCFPGRFCSSGGICWGNLALTEDLLSAKQRMSFHSPRSLSPPLLNLLSQPAGTGAAGIEVPKGHTQNTGASCNPGCAAGHPGAGETCDTENKLHLTFYLVFPCPKAWKSHTVGILRAATGSGGRCLSVPCACSRQFLCG